MEVLGLLGFIFGILALVKVQKLEAKLAEAQGQPATTRSAK